MLDIAFGLLLYNILYFLLGCIVMVFLIIPVFMNLFNGFGYFYNVGSVFKGLFSVLGISFGKRY